MWVITYVQIYFLADFLTAAFLAVWFAGLESSVGFVNAFFDFFMTCLEALSARILRYSGEFGRYLSAPSGSASLVLLFLFRTLHSVCKARTCNIILQCSTVQHSTESTCPTASLSAMGSEASFNTNLVWWVVDIKPLGSEEFLKILELCLT